LVSFFEKFSLPLYGEAKDLACFSPDYSNNGTFDEHSFDEMMKYIINQLNYNFINMCYNIYKEYYMFYSDNILKEHMSAAYSLSNDYFYLFLLWRMNTQNVN